MDQLDVIVVGAGVMGSSAAYHVARRGHKTLLLEQFNFLHHCGSSHGGSRTIRGSYPEDYYCRMVLEAYRLWEEAESEAGYKVHFRTDHLDIGPPESPSLLARVANCEKLSWPYEVLDSRQVHEKFGGRISLPEGYVGLSTEHGGVIKPTKAVSMFQALALRNGAVLKDNMEVTGIVRDGTGTGVTVVTSGGERFYGKKCVITVGAWMSKLVKTVRGVELPTQPLEVTVYYWRIKEGHEGKFTVEGDFPTFSSCDELHAFGTPMLEFPGLIKVLADGGDPCDPDRRAWGGPGGVSSGRPHVLDQLKKWIDHTFSGLVESREPAMIQSCLYTMTPDEDYVIDFLGGEFGKDVAVAGGFSGHGFKMAPVVGRVLADLVLTGEAEGVELKHFSVDRFFDNPKGHTKEHAHQI